MTSMVFVWRNARFQHRLSFHARETLTFKHGGSGIRAQGSPSHPTLADRGPENILGSQSTDQREAKGARNILQNTRSTAQAALMLLIYENGC